MADKKEKTCKDTLSVCLKMPKPADVMITTAIYQQQYEVSKFLRIKPMALGVNLSHSVRVFVPVNLSLYVLIFLYLVPVSFVCLVPIASLFSYLSSF